MKRYQILQLGAERDIQDQYIFVGVSAFQTLWEFFKAMEITDGIEKLDGDLASSKYYVCGRDE